MRAKTVCRGGEALQLETVGGCPSQSAASAPQSAEWISAGGLWFDSVHFGTVVVVFGCAKRGDKYLPASRAEPKQLRAEKKLAKTSWELRMRPETGLEPELRGRNSNRR